MGRNRLSSMRILVLHNAYQQAGGEDVVVADEMALLRAHGHQAFRHTVSNDSIQGPWQKAVTAWRTSYSDWGRLEAAKAIEETRPDIVHVHNFFPLLTPSIYDACRDVGAPIVQSLHNYRTICAGTYLLRANRPCEDCVQGTPYRAVVHSCYRGSRLGSLAVARMVDYHRRHDTWTTKIDRFIALTEFAKSKFVEAGFPPDKIAVKPNSVTLKNGSSTSYGERQGGLFVGRLSPEKGIATLLHAAQLVDVPLRVVGDGPLFGTLPQNESGSMAVLGRKSPLEICEEMSRAAFLVMPSEWYEGCPMTVLEAFSQSLPVIASYLGAMAEIIEDGVTGLLFTPGDAEDLATKMRWAASHAEEMRQMGEAAHRVYLEKYTPERNYRALMTVYRDAVATCRSADLSQTPHAETLNWIGSIR